MTTTLPELNSCDLAAIIDHLRGIYEHSPWIPERAAAQRPFATLASLKQAPNRPANKPSPA